MIISTWNVNSIKVRIHAVLQYLSEYKPDVLALQETKTLEKQIKIELVLTVYTLIIVSNVVE